MWGRLVPGPALVATLAGALLLLACGGGADDDAGPIAPDRDATPTSRPTATRTRAASPSRSATPGVTVAAEPTLSTTGEPAPGDGGSDGTAGPVPGPGPGAPIGGGAGNHGPDIPNWTADTSYPEVPDGCISQAVTTIVAQGTDPDGDALSYTWAATSGFVSGNGGTGVWQGPISTGAQASGNIIITADDQRGGTFELTLEFPAAPIDSDGDCFADGYESGTSDPGNPGSTPEIDSYCFDGLDNDLDGLTDAADTDWCWDDSGFSDNDDLDP